MFSFTQLLATSEELTEIMTWVLIGTIAVLVIVAAVICIVNKKFSTSEIAYAGICLAASFVMSFIKFTPVQYGGSITLASFVPVLIYAYKYGAIKGTLVGAIFGLLNFISGGYFLTPLSFILDYPLAFASIGLMGFAPKLGKLPVTAKVCIGTVLVYVLRFIFHMLSGFIYFAEDAIWADLPTTNMFIYSFVYQCVYLPADCADAVAVLAILSKTKTLDRLLDMMSKKQNKKAEETPAEEAPASEETKKAEETPAEEISVSEENNQD